MIRVKIPPGFSKVGDLRVVIKVGRNGFTRSDIYKEGDWVPMGHVYVDNDYTSVEFSKIGKHKERVTIVRP